MDASRRRLLTLGGTALLGTVGGCLRLTDSDESAATDGGNVTETSSQTLSVGEVVDGDTVAWLGGEESVTFADRSDSDTATVTVGNADFEDEFDPSVLRVTTGTTVTWDWNGLGTVHNVVSAAEDPLADDSEIEVGDGPLNSGSVKGGSDATYEYTFESTGTYRYYCQPHYSMGARGVVVVV
jgi:halocyanin-like protein